MSEIEQDQDYQSISQQLKKEPQEMPPAALDEKILLAAKQSVDKQSYMGVDTQPVKRAWYVPVSYVAILVLSLSVVMKLGLEDEANFENGAQPIQLPQYDTGSAEALDSPSSKSEKKKEAVARRSAVPETMSISPQKTLPAAEPVLSGSMQSNDMAPARSLQEAELDEGDNRTRQKTQSLHKPLSQLQSRQQPRLQPQQQQINKMMELLQAERYKELRTSLVEYRRQFPYDKTELKLPSVLRQWELDNMQD